MCLTSRQGVRLWLGGPAEAEQVECRDLAGTLWEVRRRRDFTRVRDYADSVGQRLMTAGYFWTWELHMLRDSGGLVGGSLVCWFCYHTPKQSFTRAHGRHYGAETVYQAHRSIPP